MTVFDSITKDTTLHLQPMFKLDENFTIIFKHTMSGNYTPMLLACVGFDKSPVDTFKNPSSANPQFFITATSSGIDIVVYNGTDYSSVLPYSLAVSNPNSQIALVQDVANKTWTTFVSNWSDDGITTSTASVVQSIPSDFKWWGSWVGFYLSIQCRCSYILRLIRSLRARLHINVRERATIKELWVVTAQSSVSR